MLEDCGVVVAHDGVDTERYDDLPDPEEARRLLGMPINRFTVGYTGHLYPGRGVGMMLQLARRCSSAHFLIVGGDQESVAVHRELVQQMQVSNLEFIGFVSNADLPLYQASCEVLLMPYQRDAAGGGGGITSSVMSPMKMFEYMAAGRLIVTSDMPTIREVLSDDICRFCPPEDVEAWVHAVEYAKAHPAWRKAVGQRAKEAVERYTWLRRVQSVIPSDLTKIS